MTLTSTRLLTKRADQLTEQAELAAESAMETTEIGIARLKQAEATHCVVQADQVAQQAHDAALTAIREGARGGTLCSSKEEWAIYLYTARAAAETRLHLYVAGEAVQSLTDPNYSIV